MTAAEIYNIYGIPALVAIQIIGAYWVYKVQVRHRTVLDKIVGNLRDYEKDLRGQLMDLRGQLTDQKNSVDMFKGTEVVG